jgi:serine/threonine-protein phosphatase 2B catalytic subunit
VDRGNFAVEVVILLFAIKLNYPDTVFMLRGNHECRSMTTHFNFRTECIMKYDLEVYDLFMDAFDTLPLA